MRKSILFLFLILVSYTGFSQGLFGPLPLFPSAKEKDQMRLKAEAPITHYWKWRLDAVFTLMEVNRNKITKEWLTTEFSAVGLAIGYDNFVPKSAIDPTPVNNYGFAIGFAPGRNIQNPDLALLKIITEIHVWQYFKGGLTITPNPPQNIGVIGYYVGAGITF